MKNKLTIFLLSFIILVIGIFIAVTLVTLESSLGSISKYSIVILASLLFLSILLFAIVSFVLIKYKREKIKGAFDVFVEESIATAGVGLLIFNDSFTIIWASKFIEDRLNKKIIGLHLNTLSNDFDVKITNGDTSFRFDITGMTFHAKINYSKNTIVLKDVTNEAMVMNQYMNEKTVIGELEIDNFQQLQTMLPEEELFRARTSVIKMLDELSEKFNLTYRQYVNGKYILITDSESLESFKEERFDFFDQIRNIEVIDGITLSASLGVGSGSSEFKELMELAKEGLLQASARGGDQTAVMMVNKKPEYFGSKNEVIKTSSRVKIKQISKLFEDKIQSSEIKKVIIYGHIHADLDAIGAALGVAEVVKAYKKEVYIQNVTMDETTKNAVEKLLSKEQKEIFIKKSKANKLSHKKDTLIVFVDTAEPSRVENEKAMESIKEENVFIFDHHRVSRLPENVPSTNVYIDTSASSASEIVTELIQFVSKFIKPPKNISQMLLNGIYLDTKQFTKSTSSRTFAASSFLEKHGATSSMSSELLKLPEEYSVLVAAILKNVREVKPGYFISSYQGEVPPDIVSLSADEILRVKNRKAAFVIAKTPGKQEFKMSARGINTNVQVIAEAVGGGGHFAAAAAVSKEPLAVFEDNLIQSIVSIKGEK